MAHTVVDALTFTLTFDCSAAEQALAAAAASLRRLAPHCCVIDCPAPAVVAIYDTRPETPYDEAETHACADHVRDLGGEESWALVEKLGQLPPVIDIVGSLTDIHVTNVGPERDITVRVDYEQLRAAAQRVVFGKG